MAARTPTSGRPNVVDSSAWLAYFAEEPSAGEFAATIEDTRRLVVPAVCLLEVFKVVARQRGEGAALQATAVMQQGAVVALDAALALAAASLGLAHKLPLADGVVYATARGGRRGLDPGRRLRAPAGRALRGEAPAALGVVRRAPPGGGTHANSFPFRAGVRR